MKWIRYYNSTDSPYGYNETEAISKCGGNTYRAKTEQEMMGIKSKISKSKQGYRNPNAHAVKCLDTATENILYFNTVKECQDYFHEKTHRFITTRLCRHTISLYKDRWSFAYINEEFSYVKNVHKTGKMVKAEKSNEIKVFRSIRDMCRTLNLNRNNIRKHIVNGETQFVINDFIITILN